MVYWDWNKKIGIATLIQNGNKFKINIYKGTNNICVFIYEFKEKEKEKYQFITFISNKKHLKNCIKNNVYNDFKVLKLNTFYKETFIVAKEFSKANIKIQLYYKEE